MLENLKTGIDWIKAQSQADTRWKYYKGEHALPFAPDGVSNEYLEIRNQSRVPLIRLAIRIPVQRLRVGGFRASSAGGNDDATWDAFSTNRLASKSRLLYTHALALGYGVLSVWEGDNDAVIDIENPLNLYLHQDPVDPTRLEYVVKYLEEEGRAWVYTDDLIQEYEYDDQGNGWVLVSEINNKMGKVPFVVFAPEQDADGSYNSMVDSLIPMQRAIDTMRFNLLLAAQFAAYRQRVVVGYDPVMRDGDGNVLFQTDADGNALTDADGNNIPLIARPGKVGVDRLLVFPGADTKVFDLDESNLTYYETALNHLMNTFASVAQVPAQHLAGDFKNVSGDLMVATEATLRGLLTSLQTTFSDSWADVWEMASLAQGKEYAPYVIWMDAEPKSLQAVADAASKMVPNGAPIRLFLEMLGGASQHDVNRWMQEGNADLQAKLARDLDEFST